MNRTILWILLIVSLAVNGAVGATVIWNLWRAPHTAVTLDATEDPALDKSAVRDISAAWPRDRRTEMLEMRQRVRDKKLEVLELIAENPGNLSAAEERIDELVQLKGQLEKAALVRIGEIMSTLPPDKRNSFLEFLRHRTCMGPGMGQGMMRRGMGRGMGRGMMGPGMGRGRDAGPPPVPSEPQGR
ncbi:MAG: hypothetical protein RDU20_14395 [Desulfomonilaceae bacterium]|nr:hypothetical protein [Desulfomonilaceae bacterium]